MNRPYENVPLIGLVILIENYTKMIKDNINMQHDLDQMTQIMMSSLIGATKTYINVLIVIA